MTHKAYRRSTPLWTPPKLHEPNKMKKLGIMVLVLTVASYFERSNPFIVSEGTIRQAQKNNFPRKSKSTQVLVCWWRLTFSTIFRQIHAISSKTRIEINATVQLVMYFVKNQALSQFWSKQKWLFVRRNFIVQSFLAISVSEMVDFW